MESGDSRQSLSRSRTFRGVVSTDAAAVDPTSPDTGSTLVNAKRAKCECPRCAYDLRGTMDGWQDCCPLEGRCSECGTGFWWADVIDPRRLDLRGFIEHAKGSGEVARWWVVTAGWITVPWIFWKRVRIDLRTVPGRTLLWLVGGMACFHATAALLGFAARQLSQRLMAGPAGRAPFSLVPMLWDLLGAFVFPFAAISGTPRGVHVRTLGTHTYPEYVIPALVFSTAFPVLLVSIPVTRRRAALKWPHIVRATVFGFGWLLLFPLYRLVRNVVYVTELAIEQGAQGPMNQAAPMFRSAIRPHRLAEFSPDLIGPLLFAWIMAWWYHALVRGWKLQGGRIIWVLLCIAAWIMAEIVLRGRELVEFWLGWR